MGTTKRKNHGVARSERFLSQRVRRARRLQRRIGRGCGGEEISSKNIFIINDLVKFCILVSFNRDTIQYLYLSSC